MEKKNSEEDQEWGYHHQVTLASFPDSHDILNVDVVQGVESLITCI